MRTQHMSQSHTYHTYHTYHTSSYLTTNPDEYGYFCDPGLDYTNYKYKKHPPQDYSYYNSKNTIYENDIENNSKKYENDTDNIQKKYKKNTSHYYNSVIYGCIIIGSVTITTLLVKHNVI